VIEKEFPVDMTRTCQLLATAILCTCGNFTQYCCFRVNRVHWW